MTSDRSPQPLIVTGTYRSGTTFLQQMIDAHPQCAVLMQPALPLFRHIRARCLPGLAKMPMDVSDSATYCPVAKSIQFDIADASDIVSDIEIYLQGRWKEGDVEVPPQEFVRHLRQNISPGNLHSLLLGFFVAISAYRGVHHRYVGLKEVYINELLPLLLDSLGPTARVIHLLRDPRGIVASRNYGTVQHGHGMHPLRFIAHMWRNAVWQRSVLAKTYPGQVLLLRYEDLARNPSTASESIARFLGLTDAELLLNEDSYRTEDGRKWRKNSSHKERTDKRDSANIWREKLPPEVVGTIEFLCAPGMELEGYAPDFSDDTQAKLFSSFRENPSTLVPWTVQPFLALDSAGKDEERARRAA